MTDKIVSLNSSGSQFARTTKENFDPSPALNCGFS